MHDFPAYLVFPKLLVLDTLFVVPKIANPRNHQGADTDASHEGLLASSSLGPSILHTAEQGLGPQSGLYFIGWSRGFSEGVEEFLKFCLHSDMGLMGIELCSHSNMGLSTMGLGSVVFLIWDYLPRTLRPFCSFSHKIQLLFTGA